MAVAFVVVGIAAGATFGSDFTDGKSSFFFARPLPTGVLIAGRFAALLTLTAAAFFSFMTSFWIVSFMCRRREWGSVQIHTASITNIRHEVIS